MICLLYENVTRLFAEANQKNIKKILKTDIIIWLKELTLKRRAFSKWVSYF